MLAGWIAAGAVFPAIADEAASRVVVLANRNVPESIELAQYYMNARGISGEHLCVLDLPTSETISRTDYDNRLRDPLLAFLRESGLIRQSPREPDEVRRYETAWITHESAVDYLVSIYGVPLAIADTRLRLAARITDRLGRHRYKNAAAVDSELSPLLAGPYDISGPYKNPLYNSLSTLKKHGDNQFMLAATRLDAPDPGTVRRMIDETIQAERYGLLGRAYFDTRGLRGGPFFVGDYWISEAYERFKREGYECHINRGEGTWGPEYPMEHAVLYLGWYDEHVSGPFTREDFRFMPGAIAYHIHSGSAATLRSTDRYWAGPLLARGAAATMGAVEEPFLAFTADVRLFADRLCRGYTLADSAYMSMSVVSWQMAVVGDPLFRPFRYTLEQQIRHLEEDDHPDIVWAHVRRINTLVREGRYNVALRYGREIMREQDHPVLREKLGDLYAINDLHADAGRQYEEVIRRAETAETAVRVGTRWLRLLRMRDEHERADALEAKIRERWSDHPVADWLAYAQSAE